MNKLISNGRINNAHIVKSSSWEELVVAFEFERNLYWSEGEIRSNGGFDIFRLPVIIFILIQILFTWVVHGTTVSVRLCLWVLILFLFHQVFSRFRP